VSTLKSERGAGLHGLALRFLDSAGLAVAMIQMRNWLDLHQIELKLFTVAAADGELLTRKSPIKSVIDARKSAKATNVSRISEIDPTVASDDVLDQLKAMIRDLNQTDDAAFKMWVRDYYGWGK
jgi:hypothetical protein